MADFNENADVDSIIERLLDGMLLAFDPATPSARFSPSLGPRKKNNHRHLPPFHANGGEPLWADWFTCLPPALHYVLIILPMHFYFSSQRKSAWKTGAAWRK